MYIVYLIQSIKDEDFYIGQTSNLGARIRRHNLGKVETTKSKRPWKLIKSEAFETRAEAMWREHILKTRGRERKKFIGD